ncbi:hypothetical protein PSTT_10906 [Puccinia striiformis]|uniref:Uncharacterized protein n=4 Tax=Puccinia striiformis TaxID=27350 RepID=A0A2S4V2H2_9BASI|nr:hypothetical protein PSTT_10906 [Puccinia striiformis]
MLLHHISMTKPHWPRFLILLQGLILCSCLWQSAHGEGGGGAIFDEISVAHDTKPKNLHMDVDGHHTPKTAMAPQIKSQTGMEKLSETPMDEEISHSPAIGTPTRNILAIRPKLDHVVSNIRPKMGYVVSNITPKMFYLVSNIRPTLDFVTLIWQYLRKVGFPEFLSKSSQEAVDSRDLASEGTSTLEHAKVPEDQFVKNKESYTVQEIPGFAGKMGTERVQVKLSKSTSMKDELNGPGRKERLEDLVSKETAGTSQGSQDKSIQKSSNAFQENPSTSRTKIYLDKTGDKISDSKYTQTRAKKQRIKRVWSKFQNSKILFLIRIARKNIGSSQKRKAILEHSKAPQDQFIKDKESYTVQEIPPFAGTLGEERAQVKLSKSTSTREDFNGLGREQRLNDLLGGKPAEFSQGSLDKSVEKDSNAFQAYSPETRRDPKKNEDEILDPNYTPNEADRLRRQAILNKMDQNERTLYKKTKKPTPIGESDLELSSEDALKIKFENEAARRFWEVKAQENQIPLERIYLTVTIMEILFESFRHGINSNFAFFDATQSALNLNRLLGPCYEYALRNSHRKMENVLPLKVTEIQQKIKMKDYKSWPQVMYDMKINRDQDLEDVFIYSLSLSDETAAYLLNRDYKRYDKFKIHENMKEYIHKKQNESP